MATPNPLSSTHSDSPSTKTFHIAGTLVVVYGLSELPATSRSISCLWLLHPRLQTKEIMAKTAAACINDWNLKSSHDKNIGLIAVSFDQRNHGTREVNAQANQAWREGNASHAQDMFSIFHGTAMDTSLLIDHLGSYIFHGKDEPQIDQHLVLGVSLGGHSSWQVILADERVTAAVVIIGCPDYLRLMSDRARLSKLSTAGPSFAGSKAFPGSLLTSLSKWDPKGLFFGTEDISNTQITSQQRSLLDAKLKGKRILVCSGGADKLVPYHCAEPFLGWLKEAAKDGKLGLSVEDNVYPGVGHAFSEDMLKDSVRFVRDAVAAKGGMASSKISTIAFNDTIVRCSPYAKKKQMEA